MTAPSLADLAYSSLLLRLLSGLSSWRYIIALEQLLHRLQALTYIQLDFLSCLGRFQHLWLQLDYRLLCLSRFLTGVKSAIVMRALNTFYLFDWRSPF